MTSNANPGSPRAQQLFAEQCDAQHRATDRMFAGLMLCQWPAAILLAATVSPRQWAGATSSLHLHVYLAIALGACLTLTPVAAALLRPGRPATRHLIAVCQAMTSALLIHVSGGRIETHFHVFGSLAFLSFYRDWRVLATATAITAADHCVRGLVLPQSIYGVLSASPWRWLEHVGWVAFEDVFLLHACRRGVREMHDLSLIHI